MKRLFTLLALSAMSLATFSACTQTNEEDPGPNPNPPGPTPSELTPDEHKQKLQDIAIELVDEFNPADFEVLINSLLFFDQFFAVEEDVVTPEDEIITPGEDEYFDETTRALKSFSANKLVDAVTRASEQFIFDLNDGAIEVEGYRYTFDESGEPSYEELNKTGIVEVAWDNAVATFTWGENNGQYTYTDEAEDIEYVVKVPAYINLSLKIAGAEHLNVNIEPTVTSNDNLAFNVAIKLNGGYEILSQTTADNEKAGYNITFKKNEKKLIGGAVEVCVNGITDIDNWLVEVTYENDNGEESVYTEVDPSEYLYNNMTTCQFRLDVLSLSIIGTGDLGKLYRELEELENSKNATYDEESEEEYEEVVYDAAYYEAYSKIINDNLNIVAVYNDTNEVIAKVITQGFYTEEWYPEEGGTGSTVISYGCEPILVFSNGSKFSLEEYFTAESFSALIERLQELYGEEYEE